MTPQYDLRFLASVEDDIDAIAEPDRTKVIEAMENLAFNPRPGGYCKMEGYKDTYRIRVGRFRIAYQIHDKILLVIVAAAAPRDKIYRLLKRR